MASSGPDTEARLIDFLSLASDLCLEGVLRQVVAAAGAWTGAPRVVLGVLDPGRGPRFVTSGVSEVEAPALIERHWPDEAALRSRIDVLGHPYAELVVLLDEAAPACPETCRSQLAGLCRVAGVAIRNARRFDLAERRREALEAMARLAESLHRPHHPDHPSRPAPPQAVRQVARQVALGAQRIARAAHAGVVRVGDDGYDVVGASGLQAGGPSGLADLLGGLRTEIAAAQRRGEPFEAPHGSGGTVAGFPLGGGHSFQGVVVVLTDDGDGALPAEDHELIGSFVTYASSVLERALLLRERQRAVVTADRDRIARDLHDVVIQRLFAAGLKLRAARRTGHLPARPDDGIEEAVRDLEIAIRDVRATIFDLEDGRGAPLRAGVVALAREYETVLGFLPAVRVWGPLDTWVDGELAEQAMSVLREALSNCARHAGADHCVVEVSVGEGWLVVVVADDGRGPGALEAPQDGRRRGWRNMVRRAEELGGECRVEAKEPRGTRVTWRVPVGTR